MLALMPKPGGSLDTGCSQILLTIYKSYFFRSNDRKLNPRTKSTEILQVLPLGHFDVTSTHAEVDIPAKFDFYIEFSSAYLMQHWTLPLLSDFFLVMLIVRES